jgi:hypothetical protein
VTIIVEPLAEPGEAERVLLRRVLAEQGLDTAVNPGDHFCPHSWRCENPDRYPGYCTCVDDLMDAIFAVGFRAPAQFPTPIQPADVHATDLGIQTGLP